MSDRATEILAEACGIPPDGMTYDSVPWAEALRAVRAALDVDEHACPVPEDYSKALAEVACARDKAVGELAETLAALEHCEQNWRLVMKVNVGLRGVEKELRAEVDRLDAKAEFAAAERDTALRMATEARDEAQAELSKCAFHRAFEESDKDNELLRAEVARLRCALAEAAAPLEALHAAGGTGLTVEIGMAVGVVRAALGIEVKP